MAGWLELDQEVQDLVSAWLSRALVLLSFAAHLVLVLFADTRRHNAFGVPRAFLWAAFAVADKAATYALSKLFFSSTSSQQQQLIAFWAPFLLLHLGRPDNICAFSLQDSEISDREVLVAILDLLASIYGAYKHIVNDRALLRPFLIMFILGVYKYVERAQTLQQGNLDKIQSSKISKAPKSFSVESISDVDDRGKLNNEDALLIAHAFFPITKCAFADYWIESEDFTVMPYGGVDSRTSTLAFDGYEWKDMCKVVQMELSLMYDIMYTKASMVHTWHGYVIRFISPPLTAAAFLLFLLHSKKGQMRLDIAITYILLVTTFVLDVRWLFRAIGSTWTFAGLKDANWPRLRDAACCRKGRWYRLCRRFIVNLDPSRISTSSSDDDEEDVPICGGWLHVKPPSSYRKWSGVMGQFNLLAECTRHDTASLCSQMVKMISSEENWMEYQYHCLKGLRLPMSGEVRKLLFEQLWMSLKSAYLTTQVKVAEIVEKLKPTELDNKVRSQRVFDEALKIGPEFQEVILIWHVATDIFLLKEEDPKDAKFTIYRKTIKALSDYMLFLVVVRPSMVPGLKLRSQYEATRSRLKRIIDTQKGRSKRNPKCIASILCEMEGGPNFFKENIILSDGIRYANLLRKRANPAYFHRHGKGGDSGEGKKGRLDDLIPELIKTGRFDTEELWKLIFIAWVRVLIHVSIRCGRDSHAKQLSRGCELTTIVWILGEHAALFRKDSAVGNGDEI